MSFKSFLNEVIEVIVPKPNKIKFKVNLKDYQETISKSIMIEDKKIIMKKINMEGGEIPVFCEELKKFFMVDINDKKLRSREVKTREDKELCGALLNGMIIKEHDNKNTEKIKELIEMKSNWEIPLTIYTYKNEFGKNISFSEII